MLNEFASFEDIIAGFNTFYFVLFDNRVRGQINYTSCKYTDRHLKKKKNPLDHPFENWGVTSWVDFHMCAHKSGGGP